MMNVSASGGLSESKANSQRNGHSGLGFAPPRVGSAGPVGPIGPRMAAIATTMMTVTAEKNASLSIASPRKGTPRFSSSS